MWTTTALVDESDRKRYQADPVLEFKAVTRRIQLSIPLLVRALREVKQYDVIIIHGPYKVQSVAVAAISLLRNTPYVIQAHGAFEAVHFNRHRLRKWLFEALALRSLCHHAAFVACATPTEAKRVGAVMPRARAIPVGLGVSPGTLVSEWSRDRPLSRVGYVGRFAEKKNVPLLISAYLSAINRPFFATRSLELRLAGATPGSTADEVRAVLATAPNARVLVEGPLGGDELLAFYDAMDVFCLPSRNENFGVAVLEACARAVPVIVSREVGLAPAVEAHNAGVVLAEVSVGAIVAAFEEVLSPENYLSYSENALQLARAMSWDRVIERWLRELSATAQQCF